MTIDKPEKFENEILNEINDILDLDIQEGQTISEMTYLERCFLNGIIRQTKPKKILELGVSAGGSSAIILNAKKILMIQNFILLIMSKNGIEIIPKIRVLS